MALFLESITQTYKTSKHFPFFLSLFCMQRAGGTSTKQSTGTEYQFQLPNVSNAKTLTYPEHLVC